MRYTIPGDTQQDYPFLLGLTLTQIIEILLGGGFGFEVYQSFLPLSVRFVLCGIIGCLTLLITFWKWPLRQGEPILVWGVRGLRYLFLSKKWTYANKN